MPFVESSQRHEAEAHGPQPVVDGFEADPFPGEGFGEEDRAGAPRHAAVGGDATDLDVTGILERRQPRRQRPRRRLIPTGRHPIAQGFVRAVVVVFVAEAGKAALLRRGMRRGRPGGMGAEDRMKLLVRAVLLGMTGSDAFGHNTESHPPDRQPGQAPSPGLANGPPLSLRMRAGKP